MALTKEVMLKILASDGDAQAKLEAIAEKADALREDNPELIARIDTAEASAKLSVFRDQLKAAAATTDEVSAALDELSTAQSGAADTAARLAELQAGSSASLDDELAALSANTAATDRLAAAQLRLQTANERTAAAAQEAGDSELEVGAKSKAAAGETEESAGLMEGAWGKVKFALLGVAGGLAYGVVKAAGFQSAMTTLNTQAGVAKSQLGSLGKGVLELAGQVGDDPDSLAQALYHIESSFASVGITGPKALSLLQTAAEGAAVGHADLVDVTNALDATIVAGVPGIKSFSGAMGALNAIVGSGDMTMQDLAEAMGTGVMAVAKSYGQSIYQVGAALAVLGDNNIRGAKAGTDLRMTWQAVQAPLKAGIPVLQSLGLSANELANTMEHHGLTGAIAQFIDHLKASKVPMSDWGQLTTEIFGKKSGVGIGIMIDQLSRLQGKLPVIEHGAKGFGAAWAAQQKTVSQQWHDLLDGLQALATGMGEKLLPASMKVVRGLTEFVNDLEKGKAPAVALAAVIGSLLAGVALEKLAGGLKTAASGFEALWNAGSSLASGIGTLAGKLPAIASGLSSAASSVASFVAQYAAKMGEAIVATGAWIAEHAVAAATFIGENVAMAASATVAFIAENAATLGLVAGIAALVAGIVYLATHWRQVWKVVEDVAKDAWHFIDSELIHPMMAGIDVLVGFIKDHWKLLATIIGTMLLGPIAGLVIFIATHWQEIRSLTSRLVDDVVHFFEQLPGRIISALSDLGSMLFHAGIDAIRGFIDGMGSMLGDVENMAESIGSTALHGVEHFLHIGSPSKLMYDRGLMTAKGFELGLRDGTPGVELAGSGMAAGLSGAVAAGRYRTGLSGGSGGPMQLEVTVNLEGGDRQLTEWLKNRIRVSGGDPRILTRKVKFA